jgi:type IV secretion system protein VirB6
MGKFYDMGQAYNDKANADSGVVGMPDLSLWLTGVAIWIAGILVTGYAAFLLALAKMALALILGIGPLFILFTIFEPTKRFFDSWIGLALNYVFLVLLTAASIKLVMTIIQTYLGSPETIAALADPSINQALPPIVFSIIATLVMIQLPQKASALGGGVAIGTLGAVNWAYGKAKGGVSSMRPTNLRRSVNKIRSDVRIAKDAAKSVGNAPMAVYRKITGGNKNRVSQSRS